VLFVIPTVLPLFFSAVCITINTIFFLRWSSRVSAPHVSDQHFVVAIRAAQTAVPVTFRGAEIIRNVAHFLGPVYVFQLYKPIYCSIVLHTFWLLSIYMKNVRNYFVWFLHENTRKFDMLTIVPTFSKLRNAFRGFVSCHSIMI
jgi:hypothetical protein